MGREVDKMKMKGSTKCRRRQNLKHVVNDEENLIVNVVLVYRYFLYSKIVMFLLS